MAILRFFGLDTLSTNILDYLFIVISDDGIYSLPYILVYRSSNLGSKMALSFLSFRLVLAHRCFLLSFSRFRARVNLSCLFFRAFSRVRKGNYIQI